MVYEWKLNKFPWNSLFGNAYIMSRHLMTKLLNEMTRLVWRVICSADVSAKHVIQKYGEPDVPLDVYS
jgi:hypothetical protein